MRHARPRPGFGLAAGAVCGEFPLAPPAVAAPALTLRIGRPLLKEDTLAAAAASSALVRAYLELRPSLVRYFAAKLRSVAAGEDLVQEIYLKIGAMAESDTVQEPKAWLFRVGSNLLVDQERSVGRAAARDHAWSEEVEAVRGESISPEPSAEAVVAARQRLGRLLETVDAMPPRMAEAFRLHKLDGVPQHEVARRMGVSVKAIEKHLAGALVRLVQAMPEEQG